MKPLVRTATSPAPTALELTHNKATVSGVNTTYWMGGASDGTPLVLLHGLSGTHHGLVPLAGKFLDFNVVLPDMPGHGRSNLPATKDVRSLSDWFLDFLHFVREQTGKQPSVVAHSFGAQIAMLACLKHSEAFKKCILLNPVPQVSFIPRLFERSLLLAPRSVAHRIGVNQHMRYWRNFYLLARHDQESIDLMQWVSAHGSTKPANMTFYIDISRELLDTASYYAEIAKASNFYCIVGDRDHMINGKAMAYLRHVFKDGHVMICQDAGHLMPIEAAAETAALVRQML